VSGRNSYWKTQIEGGAVAFQNDMNPSGAAGSVNFRQNATNSSTPAPGPAAGASHVPKASIRPFPREASSVLKMR